MWWIVVALLVACWSLVSLPLAVAVGRAFGAAERTEEPRPFELV